MKKIIKIVFIILVIFFCSIITIVMLTADKNLDVAPPKELTKQYELYAKDVNWKNIIINKKNDFVKEKEKEKVKNYEEGVGLCICEHVKYYYVSNEIILVRNNKGYLFIDEKNNIISKPIKDKQEFFKIISKKYSLKNIHWIYARKYFEEMDQTN